MTQGLGDLFYTTDLPSDLGWVTYASGWAPGTGGNALRYTRDGTKHHLAGQLAYSGSTVAAHARSSGTIVNFASFATFGNPIGSVYHNFNVIGTGVDMMWILAATGALSLYRPTNGAWALTSGNVFPVSLSWLAPPGDPDYGLGPAYRR